MIDQGHYVPILKGKAGEFNSLRDLRAEIKTEITPIIEIPPVPWDYNEDTPAKSIDQHVNGFTDKILSAWQEDRPIFIDPVHIEEENNLENGEIPLTYIFDEAADIGLQLIPVVSTSMPVRFKEAIREIVNEYNLGVCFRFDDDELDDDDLEENVNGLLSDIRVTPDKVDFAIDLLSINSERIGVHVRAARSFINDLPYCLDWRSLILAASSFPQSLSNLQRNSISRLSRTEWDMWSRIAGRPERVNRIPTYGDYTIVHPEPFEMDPRKMQLGAKIKYTHEDEWLIVKGQGIKKGGYEQFHGLCRWLVGSEEYIGREFSWGDDIIYQCSENTTGPGNQTTWVRVGVNHHITYVVEQIARFFGT